MESVIRKYSDILETCQYMNSYYSVDVIKGSYFTGTSLKPQTNNGLYILCVMQNYEYSVCFAKQNIFIWKGYILPISYKYYLNTLVLYSSDHGFSDII